jgi:hypothetical protein
MGEHFQLGLQIAFWASSVAATIAVSYFFHRRSVKHHESFMSERTARAKDLARTALAQQVANGHVPSAPTARAVIEAAARDCGVQGSLQYPLHQLYEDLALTVLKNARIAPKAKEHILETLLPMAHEEPPSEKVPAATSERRETQALSRDELGFVRVLFLRDMLEFLVAIFSMASAGIFAAVAVVGIGAIGSIVLGAGCTTLALTLICLALLLRAAVTIPRLAKSLAETQSPDAMRSPYSHDPSTPSDSTDT